MFQTNRKRAISCTSIKPRKKELVQYYAGKNSPRSRMCPSGLTRKPAAQKSQPDIRVQSRTLNCGLLFLIQRRNFESASTRIPGALNPRYRVPRSETAGSLKRSAQNLARLLRAPLSNFPAAGSDRATHLFDRRNTFGGTFKV